MTLIIKGDIAYTPSPQKLVTIEDGYVVVGDDGRVIGTYSSLPAQYAPATTGTPTAPTLVDCTGKLVIPAFNDLHTHAPQYPMLGNGFDCELLPWLERYTFPAERHFEDPAFADHWYRRFVNRMWRVGTLRFSAFASMHTEATRRLMELCQESGLRPVVGKVNMDRNAPEYLTESADDSLAGTEELIQWSRTHTPNVGYVVTPRFVPSTTSELMRGLGELADRYDLPIQSHLDENPGEVAWVRDLHPDIPTYADVYDRHGLLRDSRTIMAHCIHLTDHERDLLRDRHVFVAHCAQSNMNLSSGIMPARRWLDAGLTVTIASDVAAGQDPAMNRHIVQSIEVSKIRAIEAKRGGNDGQANQTGQSGQSAEPPLTLPEAFHMATKAGGRFFGKVGSFEPGYDFDALMVDEGENPLDLPVADRLERFVYEGDDRWIERRYVAGREVPEPFAQDARRAE